MTTTNPNPPEEAPERIWIHRDDHTFGLDKCCDDAVPYVPAARLSEVWERIVAEFRATKENYIPVNRALEIVANEFEKERK